VAAEFPEHPLWDFALGVYMTEGVGPACIALQDRHGADVNVLLFCCWLGASGRGVASPNELGAALAAVEAWNREVVRAIRAVRHRLKGGLPPAPADLTEALRRRIGKIEVDLEHVEQLMLAGSLDRAPDGSRPPERCAADAVANVGAYLATIGARLDAADIGHLARIVGAAFASVAAARIAELCRRLEGA
jgi:uncharacterized protein (TIGR02444 family)